jgi:predicted PurR-regulated permease PerM
LFFTLATAELFGLLGVFLAVPAAALVQIVIDEFICNRANPITPRSIAKPLRW